MSDPACVRKCVRCRAGLNSHNRSQICNPCWQKRTPEADKVLDHRKFRRVLPKKDVDHG